MKAYRTKTNNGIRNMVVVMAILVVAGAFALVNTSQVSAAEDEDYMDYESDSGYELLDEDYEGEGIGEEGIEEEGTENGEGTEDEPKMGIYDEETGEWRDEEGNLVEVDDDGYIIRILEEPVPEPVPEPNPEEPTEPQKTGSDNTVSVDNSRINNGNIGSNNDNSTNTTTNTTHNNTNNNTTYKTTNDNRIVNNYDRVVKAGAEEEEYVYDKDSQVLGKDSSPKTGDHINFPLLVVFIASFLIMVIVLIYRKISNQEQ